MCHKNTPSYNSSNTTGPLTKTTATSRPWAAVRAASPASRSADLRAMTTLWISEVVKPSLRKMRMKGRNNQPSLTRSLQKGLYAKLFDEKFWLEKKKRPFDVDVLSPMILGEIPWVWEVSKPWETPSGCCKPNMSQNDGFLRCWNGSLSQIPRQTCS